MLSLSCQKNGSKDGQHHPIGEHHESVKKDLTWHRGQKYLQHTATLLFFQRPAHKKKTPQKKQVRSYPPMGIWCFTTIFVEGLVTQLLLQIPNASNGRNHRTDHRLIIIHQLEECQKWPPNLTRNHGKFHGISQWVVWPYSSFLKTIEVPNFLPTHFGETVRSEMNQKQKRVTSKLSMLAHNPSFTKFWLLPGLLSSHFFKRSLPTWIYPPKVYHGTWKSAKPGDSFLDTITFSFHV